jgi:hypothetical protein
VAVDITPGMDNGVNPSKRSESGLRVAITHCPRIMSTISHRSIFLSQAYFEAKQCLIDRDFGRPSSLKVRGCYHSEITQRGNYKNVVHDISLTERRGRDDNKPNGPFVVRLIPQRKSSLCAS